MSAIQELRTLLAHRDGRIKLLYDTAEAALKELDRDYVRRDPPPSAPRPFPHRAA